MPQNQDFVKIRKKISISDYDYKLSEKRIAKYPLEQRDDSKLLIYDSSGITKDIFKNIAQHIPEQSLLLFNNSRVIHARLLFKKSTGAQIEIFCLSPYRPSDYQSIFLQSETCIWECMVGNARKWKSGKVDLTFLVDNTVIILSAERVETISGNTLVSFSWNGGLNFGEILKRAGSIPIPPYLNRESEEVDLVRYQTVYSKSDGSVAAPTAGLHFTEEVFKQLKRKNISTHEITLHVGAGTFQPVKTQNVKQHVMHTEYFTVSKNVLKLLMNNHKPVIATGTTTLRTLESIYWLAVKTLLSNKTAFTLDQWEYQSLPDTFTVNNALACLIDQMSSDRLEYLSASTEIMIVPGYSFKMTDALITNFHLPKSTLLLLIASFIGDNWKEVYKYAKNNNFRFLSYGDSSLLWNN